MRLSTKSTYGVRAMFDLALHYKDGAVAATSISKREEISIAYLEQLLNKLRRAGLVKSVRGPKGGYALARRPEDIKIGDIMRVLEGTLSLIYCIVSTQAKSCHRTDKCVTKIMWKKLSDKIEEVLDSTTLKDLCNEATRLK